jgi:hypothetical protein
MELKFNEQSEKALFIYKPNPLVPHSYQIFMQKKNKQDYEPVGDYTVIDTSEAIDITTKRLGNIVALLNGKKDLTKLGHLTRKRLLFNMVPKRSETDPTKIIFRSHDGKGVSVENAVLTIEEGVLNESKIELPK